MHRQYNTGHHGVAQIWQKCLRRCVVPPVKISTVRVVVVDDAVEVVERASRLADFGDACTPVAATTVQ